MSKSIFTDEQIILKYIPRFDNGITDKMHPLYGGLSSNASINLVAPIMKKRITDLFTKEELEALSSELNTDLSNNSKFWREYSKDEFGNAISPFPVFMKKEGMLLNKKNPMDYIIIKIMEDSNLVANSPSEIKNRQKEYRFVMIKQKEIHTEDLEKINYKKEAVKLHTKYEKDSDVLRHILKTFNKNVSSQSSLEFLQKETWKLVDTVPQLFIQTVSDPLLEAKVLLNDFVRYKLVNTSNGLYYTATGDPIRLDGETNDYDGAAKYLDSGAGQEMKLEMTAKVKQQKRKQ